MVSLFGFLGLVGPMMVIVIVGLFVILVFEILMFVSMITNKHISNKARVLWIVGALLIHPFVAIVYYLTDYKKAD